MDLPELLSFMDDRRSLLEHAASSCKVSGAGEDDPCCSTVSCVKSEEVVEEDDSAETPSRVDEEQLVEQLLHCDEDLDDWSLSPAAGHSVEDNCKAPEEAVEAVEAEQQLQQQEEEDDPSKNPSNIEVKKEEELQKKENSLYALRRNPKRSRRFIDQEYALDILHTSAGNSSAPLSSAAAAAVIPVAAAALPVASSKKHSSSINNASIFNEKARACTECGKEFSSWKALFGHMRCHPEREWRGIQRPDNISEYKFSKSSGGVRRSSKKQRQSSAAHASSAFMLEDDQEEELEALYIKVMPSDNESDTESIEAAYINGSCNASGGFNSRGKIITGKRSKRSRQLSKSSSSLQELVKSATTPAEIKEERDMARCLVMLACAGKKTSSSLGFEEDDDEAGGGGDDVQQGEDEGTSTTNMNVVHETKNSNSKGSGSSSEMENELEEEIMTIGGEIEQEENDKTNGPDQEQIAGVVGGAGVYQVQKECLGGVDESGLVCAAAAELLDHEFDGIRMKYECST